MSECIFEMFYTVIVEFVRFYRGFLVDIADIHISLNEHTYFIEKVRQSLFFPVRFCGYESFSFLNPQ